MARSGGAPCSGLGYSAPQRRRAPYLQWSTAATYPIVDLPYTEPAPYFNPHSPKCQSTYPILGLPYSGLPYSGLPRSAPRRRRALQRDLPYASTRTFPSPDRPTLYFPPLLSPPDLHFDLPCMGTCTFSGRVDLPYTLSLALLLTHPILSPALSEVGCYIYPLFHSPTAVAYPTVRPTLYLSLPRSFRVCSFVPPCPMLGPTLQ